MDVSQDIDVSNNANQLKRALSTRDGPGKAKKEKEKDDSKVDPTPKAKVESSHQTIVIQQESDDSEHFDATFGEIPEMPKLQEEEKNEPAAEQAQQNVFKEKRIIPKSFAGKPLQRLDSDRMNT